MSDQASGPRAKFVQICATGCSSDSDECLYALDEDGGVWWMTPYADEPPWERFPDKRIEAVTEDRQVVPVPRPGVRPLAVEPDPFPSPQVAP